MNTYKLKHIAKCPNGELADSYEIRISSHETIMVEDILRILKSAPTEIYQEDLATFLRAKTGAHTVVTGWHHGIEIISERP